MTTFKLFFRDFSGCRCSIFISKIVIRFVCPLAFQCRIPNCSTAKTHEDIAKRKRKVKNDGSAPPPILASGGPKKNPQIRSVFETDVLLLVAQGMWCFINSRRRPFFSQWRCFCIENYILLQFL